MNITFAVIIPTKNESQNISRLQSVVRNFDEVIFVDGNSIDDTCQQIAKYFPYAQLIHQQTSNGKGIAIALGLQSVKSDFSFLLDADLPVSENEIHRMKLEIIKNRGVQMIKGSRFLPGGGSEDFTQIRKLGAFVLTKIANTLLKQNFTEICYGFWAIRNESHTKEIVQEILRREREIQSGIKISDIGFRFEFDQYLMFSFAENNLEIREVPSYELRRTFGTSKLSILRDGMRTLRTIKFFYVRIEGAK